MIMSKKEKSIRKQAKLLARENMEAEPDIKTVYWFPDEKKRDGVCRL